MMKTENEKKFWDEILKTSNPGWNVSIKGIESGTRISTNQTVRVYVIDTLNGHVSAASLTPEGFLSARHQAKLSKEYIQEVASGFILNAGIASVESEQSEALRSECIVSAILASTITSTFDMVMDQHKTPSGHWIYICYRLKDGSSFGRPVFFNTSACLPGAFVDSEELKRLVKKIILDDLNGSQSPVKQVINAGGGAVITPYFSLQK